MDQHLQNFRHGRIAEGMSALIAEMNQRRNELSPAQWKSWVADNVFDHPLCQLLHRDPFTRRSFEKPRGYAGDAVMLDLIYSEQPELATDDPIGLQILEFARNRPAPQAVKARRERLAQLIDKTVQRRPQARILVLAAGHLREVELARTLDRGFSGEIIALDQDAESLAVIERDYAARGVRTVHAPIRKIIAGQLELGSFDLVYAAGLFDYLDQPVARALVRHMFGMLRPGGEALVANFLTGIEDVGYMESFMDWHLIYRNHAEMLDLAADVAQDELARVDLDFDTGRNIGYLSLRKPVH